jgi:hypothetical protein
MASSLQQMAAAITERSRTLINNDLKKICKEEGTAQTGNKAALQARVVGRMCFRLRFPFTSQRDVMALSQNADFIFTSHHQCRLQKRRRSAAAAAVPSTTSRRRATSRSQQQQPRRSFLHSAPCTSRQRLRHGERIPEQRIVSIVSAAPNAVAYAHLAPQPSPDHTAKRD